jgi:ferredoxin like protein
MENNRTLSLEEKLFLVRIRKHRESHLVIGDSRVCRDCENRECIPACPAGTYTWEEDRGEVNVAYENCLECGTCRIVCPYDNILWSYPPGGSGVELKHG